MLRHTQIYKNIKKEVNRKNREKRDRKRSRR